MEASDLTEWQIALLPKNACNTTSQSVPHRKKYNTLWGLDINLRAIRRLWIALKLQLYSATRAENEGKNMPHLDVTDMSLAHFREKKSDYVKVLGSLDLKKGPWRKNGL